MSRSGVIARSFVGVMVLALPIFVAAGRWDFWNGWRYVALAVVGTALTHALARGDADLTVDRAARAREGEAWDRRLLGAIFGSTVVMYVVAGLDAGRFGWSGPVAWWVPVVGATVMLSGQLLFAIARRENAFFSSTVRLQEDRGHEVCDRGVYRRVRHPGYTGMLLSILAFPFVLGSYWSLGAALCTAALLVVRTWKEDRFLMERLTGYRAYAERTRWRLVPGVL